MSLLSGLASATGEKMALVPASQQDVNLAKIESTVSKEKQLPMWKIIFRITGGDHDGHPLYDQIMKPDPSADKFQNEQRLNQFKRLCVAAGVDVSDEDEGRILEELHGKGMKVIVGIRKNKQTNKDANNIEDYLPA